MKTGQPKWANVAHLFVLCQPIEYLKIHVAQKTGCFLLLDNMNYTRP